MITRPEPQAGRLAAALRAEGARVVVSPLMRPVFLTVTLPEGDFATVILTSEAGAMAAARLPGLPRRALCVGERTAEVARAGGFDARSLGSTAAEMLPALAAEPGPFLYLRGREASVDVAAALRARGKEAASAVVYAQEPAPLSGEAQNLLKSAGIVTIPLYSARSARLFLAACPPDAAADLRPVVIAPPVLEALPEALRAKAVVAERPDGPAMQAAILRVIRSLAP
nr:uroporphyrinogen-III synthase [Rhodobacter sp. SGA-6-6]